MKIYTVDNIVFDANKPAKLCQIRKLSKDKSFTEINPIKNYSQYIKEYGLEQYKPKKTVAEGQVKKDTM